MAGGIIEGGRRKYQRRPPERREVGLKGPNIDPGKFWRERFFGGGGIGWCSLHVHVATDFEPHARAQRSGRGL